MFMIEEESTSVKIATCTYLPAILALGIFDGQFSVISSCQIRPHPQFPPLLSQKYEYLPAQTPSKLELVSMTIVCLVSKCHEVFGIAEIRPCIVPKLPEGGEKKAKGTCLS